MSELIPSKPDLSVTLELLLFIAPNAVSSAQLAEVLGVSVPEIEAGLTVLENYYVGRYLRLQRHAGRIQLTTAPEAAVLVEIFLDIESTSHLTRAALETLAIIAYQQPITRPKIDAIRGVNSDYVLKSLLSKGLLQEVGRTDGPGRPILYSITTDFLHHFGLNSITELPPLSSEGE